MRSRRVGERKGALERHRRVDRHHTRNSTDRERDAGRERLARSQVARHERLWMKSSGEVKHEKRGMRERCAP